MRTRVKFCGCASNDDARLAIACGADGIGFTFAPSPRQISLDVAAEIAAAFPPFVTPVGVFVDPTAEQLGRALRAIPKLVIQLSGHEAPEFVSELVGIARVIKVLHVDPGNIDPDARELTAQIKSYREATIMFDTKIGNLAGGTGVTFAWETIAAVSGTYRVGVAGGLTPENVGDCVRMVRPYFVDVRTGIESEGKKDARKMTAFIDAVCDADRTSASPGR